MDKLNKFLLQNFLPVFFTIFFILFLITSIVIIISIANITSNIHITFLELFELYLLSLPKVIFITVSISFFIATVNTFTKLSDSQELIAFFTAGITPFKLLKPFLFLSLIATTFNFIILFVSIPYAKTAFKNFKASKQQVAKFNFQTSQTSQRFGNWNIFTASKQDDKYINLILYNDIKHQFIISDSAKLKKEGDYLKFELNEGKMYLLDNNTTVTYKLMDINQKIPKSNYSIFKFDRYFKEFKSLFEFYLPFVLIPISLIFFIPPISFFHPRIHKNRSLSYSVALLTLYLVVTKISQSFTTNLIISFLFFLVGYIFYKRKVPF